VAPEADGLSSERSAAVRVEAWVVAVGHTWGKRRCVRQSLKLSVREKLVIVEATEVEYAGDER
jgi:hypothetical protein